MSTAAYAASAASTLFRLLSYVFLRVIPTGHLKFVLPSLYAAYAILFWATPEAKPLAFEEPVAPVAEGPKALNGAPPTKPDGKPLPAVPVTRPAARTRRSPLAVLLLSLPAPGASPLRFVNFALNTLLLALSLDLLAAPLLDPAAGVAFARVGALYPDGAKLHFRVPPRADVNGSTSADVRVVFRAAPAALSTAAADAWRDGPLVTLSADADWTGTARLSGLWPGTAYEARLADAERFVLPGVSARALAFRTFPDPRLPVGARFRFLVGSCQTVNFPYAPWGRGRIKGYDLLADYLWPHRPEEDAAARRAAEAAADWVNGVPDELKEPEATTASVVAEESTAAEITVENTSAEAPLTTEPAVAEDTASAPPAPPSPPPIDPEFMLFLGDFVYADVPVHWGDSAEAYRRLYRRTYNSPSFRKVYERLPMMHTYDDHEIINNFAGASNDSAAHYPNASAAYALYNGEANPDSVHSGEAYYSFRRGDAAFFVLDTRRHRSDLSAWDAEVDGAPTMLGAPQLDALHAWLVDANNTAVWKFVASSVPLTALWTHDAQTDSWAGYADEKARVLDLLASVPNVIVLSGDRHEAATIEFAPNAVTAHRVLEVSTSPLSMFYVPLLRTLLPRSAETVPRARSVPALDDEGRATGEMEAVVEDVPREQVLNYTPVGNYKWSSFEVDTTDPERPLVKLELVVGGKPAYTLEIEGTPVKIKGPGASIASFVPQSFGQMLKRVGLDPSKWF